MPKTHVFSRFHPEPVQPVTSWGPSRTDPPNLTRLNLLRDPGGSLGSRLFIVDHLGSDLMVLTKKCLRG